MTSSAASFFPDEAPTITVDFSLTGNYDWISIKDGQSSLLVFTNPKWRYEVAQRLRVVADQLEQAHVARMESSDAQD